MKKIFIYSIIVVLFLVGCSKSDFLNKKPTSDIVQPTTIPELQSLLDNWALDVDGALSHISADEYYVTYEDWLTLPNKERNAHIWTEKIYDGDQAIDDWDKLYQQIFYANVVLSGLEEHGLTKKIEGSFTKGWALFNRSYAFYDLTRNFCKSYNEASAEQDLGIPLRTNAEIDYTQPRATLSETFNKILVDAKMAAELLPESRTSTALNRPSRIAAYALLARIYLDMRDYKNAEVYADKALQLYDKLTDYNTVSQTSATPFSLYHEELIFRKFSGGNYFLAVNRPTSKSKIPVHLIDQYDENDLRKQLYFDRNASTGQYTRKRGYSGSGNYPFTGLATDELYLIKAECLARANQPAQSMEWLNKLLVNRYVTGTFTTVVAANSTDALSKVLLERKKELIWRGLRWHDLKRLNLDGANITLTRELNGQVYILPPNDPRYVLPIPDDEIALSGIEQNLR